MIYTKAYRVNLPGMLISKCDNCGLDAVEGYEADGGAKTLRCGYHALKVAMDGRGRLTGRYED